MFVGSPPEIQREINPRMCLFVCPHFCPSRSSIQRTVITELIPEKVDNSATSYHNNVPSSTGNQNRQCPGQMAKAAGAAGGAVELVEAPLRQEK